MLDGHLPRLEQIPGQSYLAGVSPVSIAGYAPHMLLADRWRAIDADLAQLPPLPLPRGLTVEWAPLPREEVIKAASPALFSAGLQGLGGAMSRFR